jgi:hypothetical protein
MQCQENLLLPYIYYTCKENKYYHITLGIYVSPLLYEAYVILLHILKFVKELGSLLELYTLIVPLFVKRDTAVPKLVLPCKTSPKEDTLRYLFFCKNDPAYFSTYSNPEPSTGGIVSQTTATQELIFPNLYW